MRKIFSLLLAVLWVQQLWAQYNPDNPADPDVYYALTLEASPSAGGSVSPGSTLQVAEGMTVTCKAIANSGYRFVQWTQDGLLISTESTFDYVMPANDVKLIAVFEWEPDNPEDPDNEGYSHKINLEASPASGGYFENNTLLVVEGKTVKIKAYPYDGYRFSVWKKDGETVSTENPMTVVMGTEDVTYTATFEYAPNNPGDPDLKEPYAVLSEGNTVLTFYYDGKKDANGGMSVGPFSNIDFQAWYAQRESITKAIFDPSFAKCTSITSTAYWFFECKNLAAISGIEYLNTDNVTDMDGMFDSCSTLTSLDVSGFKTDNVMNMNCMFRSCSSLMSLDVSGFETDNVTDMGGMFDGCSSLTSLDVSGFKTDNVTNMNLMFGGCSGLASLDVSHFITNKVLYMGNMFDGCSGLTSLDVSGFKTDNVTNMVGMFYGCSGLTSLDVSGFNTDKVSDMWGMFYGCSGLTSLDVSGFKTNNVVDMGYMFYGCSGLTTIYAGDGWTTANVTESAAMFEDCTSLVGGKGTTFDAGHTDKEYARIDEDGKPGYLTDINGPLPYALLSEGNSVLTFYYDNQKAAKEGLSVGPFTTGFSSWYGNRNNIEKVVFDASFANCKTITSTEFWFYQHANLSDIIDLENLNTQNVSRMNYMFDNCSSLATLDLSHFNTSKVKSTQGMFRGCSALSSLDISNFDTSNVKDMLGMFYGCSNLTTLNVSSFNTSKVTVMGSMFRGCSALTTIYAGDGWSTASVTNSEYMFTDCTNLVGGNGTPYNDGHTDYTYARIDADGNPGYFTYKAPAVSEPYAVLVNDGTVLKFFYDDKKEDWGGGMSVGPFTVPDARPWNEQAAYIVSVEFDPSFAGCTTLTSTAYWFDGCSNLTSITNIENLKTDNVTDMHEMFVNCSSLTSLSLSGFKTDNVTNMNLMFHGCSALTNLDASGFKTDNVTGMNYMFYGCYGLTSLNVSGFKTENVTDMAGMFRSCSGLTSLDISGFKTDNVKGMSYMFNGCSSLTTIYAGSGWTTANVISSEDMFSGCTNLVGGNGTPYSDSYTDAEYARIDTPSTPGYFTDINAGDAEPYAVLNGNVLAFYYDGQKDVRGGMSVGPFSIPSYRGWANHVADITTVVFQPSFADCTTLTSTAFWFFECPNLTTINGIENLKTPQVTNMDSMFKGCFSLTNLDVTGFDMGNVTRIDGMFYGCSSLTSLDLHNFNTSKVTSLFDLFHDCSGLTSLDLRSFDTSGVTTMEQLFDGCSSLTSLDISTFNTSKVTNMHNLFDGCSSLTSLDVSHFNTEEVTNMDAMFYNCKLLTSLDLHKFNTEKVTTMRSMFYNCAGLTSLDLSSFNTSEVMMMNFMFEGCSGLTSLDLHNFNTSKVLYTNDMFYGCANLLTLDISGFDMTNVTSLSGMFSHCSSLASIQLGNAKIPGSVLDVISNPNLLVYVNSSEAVPSGIQNVVVNNEAEEIVLTFTWEGNGNFYCPKQFVAHKIRYTHEFSMETEIGVSRGWETIALPFTVQSITHEKNGPLAPFGAEGGKPFWLGQMTPQGLVAAQQIVANVPYVISMPNNSLYPVNYNQAGAVTFSATNCEVPVTEQHAVSGSNCTLVSTFLNVGQSPNVYAINLYDAYDSHPEGSIFVANLREVRPFEAYTLHPNGSRAFISIDELMASPTGIQEMEVVRNAGKDKVYNLNGQRLTMPQKGVNIMNGRKVVIK